MSGISRLRLKLTVLAFLIRRLHKIKLSMRFNIKGTLSLPSNMLKLLIQTHVLSVRPLPAGP